MKHSVSSLKRDHDTIYPILDYWLVNHSVITHLGYESDLTQQKPPKTLKIDKDIYWPQIKWDFYHKIFTRNV